jgi:Protein of unknown function (DUF3995)
MGPRLPLIASAGLAAIGALHVVWATGSSWPAGDRDTLADQMAGQPPGGVPSAAACLAVAGLLGTAAALVSGRPRRAPFVSRAGSAGVVGVLLTRGTVGLAGRTDLLSPGAVSPAFRRRDRHYYSPLCLALAACAAPAIRRGRA